MPPRKSPRKKATAAVAQAEDKTVEKKSDKVNGAAKKTKAKAPAAAARTTGRKRKAVKEEETDGKDADEDHECDSHGEEAEEAKKPVPKKRKTAKKENKDEDMAPLAERTAVSSLKKAMYIGAHVSAAGGMSSITLRSSAFRASQAHGQS